MRQRRPNCKPDGVDRAPTAGPPVGRAGNEVAPPQAADRSCRSGLRDRGVVNVRPKVAAEILGTSELQLRRYRKQNPDRLRVVRQGVRAIAYPLDDIERMARDGWTLK